MASLPLPFYGCLCLEIAPVGQLSHPEIRQQNGWDFPEIHFNIWEHPCDKNSILDIGLMLDINEPAQKIEIFLPWALKRNDIEDLSAKILVANGVSAVFNESWTSSTANIRPGGCVERDNGTFFSIVPYAPEIVQRVLPMGTFHSIVFDIAEIKRTSLAAASPQAHPALRHMYVRIRVQNVPPSFYRVGIDQGDAFGGSALTRTEIIDFRMNVRRGAPTAVEATLSGRFLEFSKVHLFLMKARDHDIVFEDKQFKACRSLEDEAFWATYILGQAPTAREVKKSRHRVKNSLGYQWRKTSSSAGGMISEFGMLARFKSFKIQKLTMALFLLLALLVGCAGNGAYDLLKNWLSSSNQVLPDLSSGKSAGESTGDSRDKIWTGPRNKAPSKIQSDGIAGV